MGTNCWISSETEEFGTWSAKFIDSKMSDPQLALAFLTRVLAAGERERVLRVKQTVEPFPYHELMGISYAKHLENVLNEHGKLVFFEHFNRTLPRYYWSYFNHNKQRGMTLTPAYLCYYTRDGQLVRGEVTDMGQLIEEANYIPYDCYVDDYPQFGYPNRPIEIHGELNPTQTEGTAVPFYVSFTLKTDIWLPKVSGKLEKVNRDSEGDSYAVPPEYEDLTDTYSNLELAMCHTPRLNRFLAEVRRLTLELGGEWTFEAGTGSLCDCNENGITLPETLK